MEVTFFEVNLFNPIFWKGPSPSKNIWYLVFVANLIIASRKSPYLVNSHPRKKCRKQKFLKIEF